MAIILAQPFKSSLILQMKLKLRITQPLDADPADIVITEIGGTVGDIESLLY